MPPSPEGEGFTPAGGTEEILRSAADDMWNRGSRYSGARSSGLAEARQDRLRKLEARRSELTAGLDLEGAAALDNEINSLRKQLGRTFPQQAARTVSGMAKAIPAGLEGFLGSTANAWTSLYQGGQTARDTQNREYLQEYTDGLEQSRRRLDAMLRDNSRSPGTWGDGDIQSQQNIVNDWQRKYDAMSNVVGEDIQLQATRESYGVADALAADSARRLEEAKQGVAAPGRVLIDATGSLVQNVADMGVNALLSTPGSMGSFAMRAFGGGAQQARQEMEAMGTADQEGAFEKQLAYGLSSMAKEIATEKMFGLSAPFGAAYGKGSLDDLAQDAVNRVVSRFAGTAAGKRALERGLNFVNSAASEGLEELIGDWMEWQLPRIYGGEVDPAREVLENSLYDFLVGAASGGLGDVTYRGAGRALDAVTGNTAKNTGAQFRAMGDDVVQATIDEGLSSADGTISNTMAQELQSKLDRGETVSDREIGQLYQANVEAIEAENAAEHQTQQEQPTAAAQTAQETARTPANEMTRQAPQERTEAVRAIDTARVERASSALGENGQKALNATYDGQTGAREYYGGFSAYYQAGVSGQDINKVSSDYGQYLTKAQQYAAYSSGKNDAALSLSREKEAARFAPVAGEKSGLVYDDFVRQAVESGRTAQDVNQESRVYLSKETADRINMLAKDLGVRVRFVDSVAGGVANAQIKGSEVLVERNNPNPVMAIVGHELTHRMQELAPEAYREFRDIVMQEEGQDSRVRQRIADYSRQGVTLDTQAAMDEVAADYAGRMMDDGKVLDDFIRKHHDNRTVLQKLRDAFRSLWQKLTGKEKQKAGEAEKKLTAALEAATAQAAQNGKNNARSDTGEARYSINEQFGQDIQEWNEEGRPAGERFVLGTTGPVLQGLGAIESDIYMNGDKISSILDQHPEMTVREIQRIPDILEDPVLVMKSRNVGRGGRQNTRLVMFGSVKAQDGRPVMCVLDLRPMERGFVVSDMQKVTSAYTKDSNPIQYFQNSEILHADKKRTVPLLRTIGFYMPIELQRSGSIGSISYNKQNVNLTGEKFSDVVELGGEDSGTRYSLKEYTDAEKQDHAKAALEYFGRTYSWKETGYLTQDGKKIDFSGRHDGGPGGYRTVDHRDISDALGLDYGGDDYSGSMVQFMSEGNIRISPESGGINLSVAPTKAQEQTLDDFISRERGEVILDIDAPGGDTVVSVEYPRGTRASKVLSDIRQYFKDGTVPQVSELAQFRYSLKEYSPEQIEDWSGSKSIVIYKDQAQFRRFIKNAMDGYNLGKKLYFGAIPADLATRIKADTGIDVDGYNCTLRASEIRKILSDHGTEETEIPRGQRPISEMDLLSIPEIIQSPDNIALSNKLYEGKPVILFEKTIDGKTTVVSYVSRKHHDLTVQTMYSGQKKSLATTPGEVSPFPHTSETLSGTALEQSVSQDGGDVNTDGENNARYSLKEGTISKSYEALLRENDLLRERVDYWKGQTRRTERITTDKKAVEKAARALIRDYGAQIELEDIRGDLQSLYDYISSGSDGKDELTYTEARRRAENIAQTLVENAVAVDDTLYQDYQDLRKHLKDIKLTISEADSHDIQDFNGFRKRNFGRLNIGKGRTNIDQVYQELAERWPGLFNEQEYSNPADQLYHIAEVLDTVGTVNAYNPFSGDMRNAVAGAANEIMERFFDLPQTRATFADRQAQKLENAKGDLRQQLRREQERSSERLGRLRERNRAQVQRAIERERTVRDRQLQRLKDHYAQVQQNRAERQADSATRSRLLKIARRLQNKKLPAVNRALLDQYIGDLDTTAKSMTGRTLERLSELKDWYAEQKENDPDFIADPSIEKELERLSKRHIGDMTADEVEDLTRVLLNIENELRTKRKLIDSEDRRDIYLQGVQAINDIENSGGNREGGVMGAIDKYIVTETLSPLRQIKRMAGYVKSDPLIQLTNALADGQRSALSYQMEAERPFRKWAENKKFSQDFSGDKAKTITITGLVSGKGMTSVEITPAMRASLYLHSLNGQNLRHIRDGGITVPDMNLYKQGKIAEAYARGTTIKLTPSQVRSITANMTMEEKAFAKAVHDYFNGQSRDRINEVSEKLKGYSIAQVENYFPINTDTSFTRSDFETLKFDGTLEGMGFLKERMEKAANPIYLRDVNDVLQKSIDQHSKYVGLAIPVRNFNKVWGVTKSSFNDDGSRNSYEGSVQKAVKKAWGESGYNYIEKMMTDLQGGGKQKNVWTKALNKLRSNYAGAVLTLNASVAMKQAASYPTAAAVLGWGPLARAMADTGRVNLDLIAKYTPLQWYRSKGFSTKELGDLRQAGGPIAKVMNNLPPALNWVQGADLLTTRKLWKASEYYVRANNRELSVGTNAYYRAVAEVYNRVIEETQPNYTTMQRPQLLRSDDSLLGNLAMFKTQPFQNFNILYDAAGEYIAAKKSGVDVKTARKNLRNAVTSQLAQLAVFAGMTMAWAMFRGRREKYEDEDGEMSLQSVVAALGKDMFGGQLSTVPFGSDAWELVSSKLFGDQYYGMDAVTVTAISDTISSLNGMSELIGSTLKNVASGEDVNWNSARIKLDGYMDDISKAAGVPYENVVNLFNAGYRHTCIAALGKYQGEYAALKMTADPEKKAKYYYDLLYKAMERSSEQYDTIYRDMVDSGNFSPDKISSAMETRMKAAQGVERAEELKQRYLSPDQEREYSRMQKELSGTRVWRAATAEQRSAAEEDLYDIVSGNRAGEKLAEKISGGSAYGIDETDYILYRLALHVADQPTESGKLGTYTNGEVEAAINMLSGLSDAARGYLWQAQGKSEKSNPYS